MNSQKIASALMLALIALGLLFFEQRLEKQIVYEEAGRKQDEVLRAAQEFRLNLSLNFAGAVHVLYGLKSYIEANPNFTRQEFDRYAASIKRVKPSIRNIAAAPNLVVKFMYPLKGNEAIVGLDFRKAPIAQRDGVFRAMEEGKPVIAGPVNLIQGGQSFILRIPVYLENGDGGFDAWGIIGAPIDMDALFIEAGVEKFTQAYDLAIRGQDGLGAGGAVFYGNRDLFAREQHSILLKVTLENGSWILAIKPKEGWPEKSPYDTLLRASFIAVFLIIGAIWITASGYLGERARSRDRKQAAIREKSEFLEILSHEIRSPLQGVLAAQKYLLDTGLVEPMRSIVETANQSGDFINGLINDYLDLQRAESGNLPINLSPTNIGDVIEKIVKILTNGPTSDAVSLNYYVSEDVPKALLIDQAKVSQILMNIVGNALKFTENGFIIVNASYSDRAKNPSLLITVEDTGSGIDADILKGLFNRFTRSRRREENLGSGLGLAIARSLAHAMGGDITAESEIGKGSSFMIEIPAEETISADKQNVEAVDEKCKRELSVNNAVHFKEARILVADDVAINRMLLNAMLSPLVKNITMVADGNEVLKALDEAPFDIIIMDVQMPNMDGIEATKFIRGHERYKTLPIVGLTGEEAAERQEELLAIGMNAVLIKPISFEPLLCKLRECYGTQS